jgi:hypothetical protein
MRSRTTRCFIAAVALVAVIASPSSARAKGTKKKKKASPVAAATPAPAKAGGATRNFTCVGTPNIQLTWRNVSGTIDAGFNLTNVTVTQIYQKVNEALVEQPTVVLTAPNPTGKEDLSSPLFVYRLNEVPPATAADVDRLLTIYSFNFPNVLPAGPTFKAGLYFNTQKGVAGPLANEYKWSYISSLAYSGAYDMNCQYT